MIYKLMEEMLVSRVHLGHKSNIMNKLMKPYVINIDNKLNIINLEKSALMFMKVIDIIKNLIRLKKTILIVCAKKNTKNLIRAAGRFINMPYVNKRWLGGTLTNFNSLTNGFCNLNYLRKIIENRRALKLKKRYFYIYNKKIKRRTRLVEGIENLDGMPDFIFTIDSRKHKNLISEANKMKIPIACVVDTDCSPLNINYVIPGNDDSFKSVFFFIKKIVDTIRREYINA